MENKFQRFVQKPTEKSTVFESQETSESLSKAFPAKGRGRGGQADSQAWTGYLFTQLCTLEMSEKKYNPNQ